MRRNRPEDFREDVKPFIWLALATAIGEVVVWGIEELRNYIDCRRTENTLQTCMCDVCQALREQVQENEDE